ncbi:SDR family NAD(P)-dependent oxidoreductase [Rhodovulum sulfidophilum]|uniref:type I polyketide synthase n=1 Tax=Rhodovulum sulfidophilum TaxID=35806 RepID=UPI0019247643|nr:type I polyketide synthase [Rhodovulum sulfidophilum]MBL3575099.1 SDR family NAD(P)-dependent oxidoreductase [Rhodovulum sulfidophilum]MCE8430722.1 SDR family NAD(P)-dependent oxidoreductase [Rhodovulum sulfidophilum]MCF4118561.1 SDR family NAD(P)-dependent oxidoreductase [Rhodovulum sulfidophilum]
MISRQTSGSEILTDSETCVTGYSAILPGADGLDAVWQVLSEGRCTISDMPEDRWSAARWLSPEPGLAGHSYTRRAGIVAGAFDFDAGCFGITPREAEQMDPQQRLLIEVTARAFDHAGIDPAAVEPERVGVFIGAASLDHSTTMLQDPQMAGPQYMLGNTGSIMANRISHQWNLQGPSYIVDTACSSGLFALDHARRAIGSGQIDMAIVGAVNLLMSPMPFVGFSQAGMLSPQGLCRAFAKGADGYVRSEGAVAFVLERLDSAQAAGRRVRSVLVATSVNAAGRTPGIALPSADRQAALIEAALTEGGYDPEALAFVEAHGTGTAVGDPREADAIGRVYGRRRALPLPIGSAKSNFGHLEPASGLVGLLKAQLALERQTIPATLHCDEPNPDIDFAGLNLDVARSARALPAADRPWLAAVNSFGFGGANAHAVIRQPRPDENVPVAAAGELPPALLLSAANETTLADLARSWLTLAETAPADLGARIATANWRRARHRHRLCLAAGRADALAQGLADWLEDPRQAAPGATAETALRDAPVAFVYAGNGAMWAGAARTLIERDPTFRTAFNDIAHAFAGEGIAGLAEALADPDLEARLGEAELAQPLTFAIQVALTEALAEAGLRPDAVLGHSMGEVAAAIAAGRIAREDGIRIIAQRSRAFEPLRGKGGMAAFAGSRAQIEALIATERIAAEISAENAPDSVTVSGSDDALKALTRIARAHRIAGRILPIPYPYHSAAVETLRPALTRGLARIAPRDGSVPFYSGWDGSRYEAPLDGVYWWRNARLPVAFRAGVQAMAEDGIRVFVEISPRTVLRSYLRDTLAELDCETRVLESLDSARAEARDAGTIARAALAAGGATDRARILGPEQPVADGLPDYPFDRQTYRLDSPVATDIFHRRPQHPFLGTRLRPDSAEWQGEIALARTPWLGDHRVGGRVLLPATAMVEMFAHAGCEILKTEEIELRDVEFLRPLELPEKGIVEVRLVHEPTARRMRIEAGGPRGWTPVAVARLFSATAARPAPVTAPEAMGEAEPLYAGLRAAGLDYGPDFARVTVLDRDGTAVRTTLAPRDGTEGFRFDPAVADAGLHGAVLLFGGRDGDDRLRVPARIAKVRLCGRGRIVCARLTAAGGWDESLAFDTVLADATGTALLSFEGMRLRPLPAGTATPHDFWDERLVPLAGDGAATALRAAKALCGTTETASDADVLRAALGSRLAWDLLAEGAAPSDPRQEAARRWMVAAGHDRSRDVRAPDLPSDCPWPTADALLTMLPEVAPGASAELKSALAAAAGEDRPADPLPQAARTLDTLLDSAAPLGRIALAGLPDLGLVAAALRAAGHVTVLAEDKDALDRLRARLDTGLPLRFLALTEAGAADAVDLVLGCCLSQGFAQRESAGRLAALVAPGGALIAAEEAPDLFALMTRRHRDADALDRLEHALHAAGLDTASAPASGSEALRLIRATRPARRAAPRPELRITGSGPLAEALRALPQGSEAAVALHCAVPEEDDPLGAARIFRALPNTDGTLWIAVAETGRWEELTGWRRVVANETGRDIRLICAAPGVEAERIAALAATSPETEIRLTATGAAAPRVVPVRPLSAETGPRRLVADRRGVALDGLVWQTPPARALQPSEIEIEAVASGLNFRDVMWAQGLLPPEALEAGFSGPCLGMECAGTVLRAGIQAGLKPGDRVIAMAPHAMASRVITRAEAAMPLPDTVDPEAAAGLPVVFVTADYALTEVARLAPGETVLVHGGAGGVGLAALQVARRLGARVFATAGSPAKRRLVAAMGAEAVFDSRSLGFEDEVMAATGGRGVDVVLNSLAGEAMERSLACLAPFGRFVELGKRDLYENNTIALHAMRNNIGFHAVDADQLLLHRPDAARRTLARLRDAFAEGVYQPLPVTAYPAEDVAEAIRSMQRAAHVGKIVLRAPQEHGAPRPAAAPIRGGWLVVGGTRGFGLETARWLAAQGAEHLWLMSKSGTVAPGTLDGLGTAAEALACDVADATALDAALTRIRSAEVPLRGVVHAAAIFDDAPLADLDEARLSAVLTPKLVGGQALDRLTRTDALDHFWVFSSIAARFGNPAQAPYVAANRGLEGLARARREAGLPGLAIAWGPIADAGYLARETGLREALARRLPPMTTAAALHRLGRALAAGACGPTLTVAPMDWSRMAGTLPVLDTPLFDLIDIRASASGPGLFDLDELLRSKGPKEARKVLTRLLVEEAAQLMRAAPGDIDPRQPLELMGFDSLMAINLRMAVEERLGANVPVMSIDDGLTLAGLVNRIIEAGGAPGAEAGDAMVEEMARRHLADGTLGEDRLEQIRTLSQGRTGGR